MGAMRNFLKKLSNFFYFGTFKDEFEEDDDNKKCTYTLSSIFPSPEIRDEVFSILEKQEQEKQEVS